MKPQFSKSQTEMFFDEYREDELKQAVLIACEDAVSKMLRDDLLAEAGNMHGLGFLSTKLEEIGYEIDKIKEKKS